MATFRDANIRLSSFAQGWPRYPRGWAPLAVKAGWRQYVARQIVSTAFHPARLKGKINWRAANADERWAAQVSLWHSLARKVRGVAAIRAGLDEQKTINMLLCPPPGYVLDVPEEVTRYYPCDQVVCPFCYARKVAVAYAALADAVKKRPDPAAPLYLSPFEMVASPAYFYARLRKARPAAAYAFREPVPPEAAGGKKDHWLYRGVLLTDDRTRVAGRKVLKVTRPGGIALALRRWLKYPRRWSAGGLVRGTVAVARRFAELPKNTVLATPYGAARADYAPAKGWLDFAALDPKG